MKKIGLIVGRARNGVIGNGLKIPWPMLKDDMKNFKALTLGYDLIMGRKTAESLGKPLSGRRNIVISRQDERDLVEIIATGFVIKRSYEEAVRFAQEGASEKIWVIGGAEIYMLALNNKDFPLDELHVTEIDGEFEGDVYCPMIDLSNHDEVDVRPFEQSERNPVPFVIKSYLRRT